MGLGKYRVFRPEMPYRCQHPIVSKVRRKGQSIPSDLPIAGAFSLRLGRALGRSFNPAPANVRLELRGRGVRVTCHSSSSCRKLRFGPVVLLCRIGNPILIHFAPAVHEPCYIGGATNRRIKIDLKAIRSRVFTYVRVLSLVRQCLSLRISPSGCIIFAERGTAF